MKDKRQCPKCGTELSADAAQGLCPKCLLDAGFESQAAARGSTTGPFVTPSQAAAATIPPSSRFPTPYLATLARQFPQLDSFEHLGQGGMGVVYKARQRQLDRIVAVKLLPPSVGEEPAFAERFTREAQALARLNHSNIVQVYDFGRTDDYFYFVMEYVDGVNLRALIRDHKLDPEAALKIVPQICEALQFAHDEGIVHRDIKPENILVDKKGRVKIADFGLAKLLGRADDLSLTGTGQLMGTLGYMAPEQLQPAHKVDHRADIYSLGVVFYEMLTGQLPIGRFDPPSKKVQVDVRLDEIVLRSLESEPDRRYQHAADIKTDVQELGVETARPAAVVRRSGAPEVLQEAEAKRLQEIAQRPPMWLVWGAIGLFLVGWMFAGAMSNLGEPGVLVGIAILAAIAYRVLGWLLKYRPELQAELSRQGRFRRGVALGIALLLYGLAVLGVAAAHHHAWNEQQEAERREWVTKLPPTTQGTEAREIFPLDKLQKFAGNRANLDVSGGGRVVFGSGSPQAMPLLLEVMAVTLVVISVMIVVDTRRYRATWKFCAGPSVSIALLFAIGFLLADFVRVVGLPWVFGVGPLVTLRPAPLELRVAVTRALDNTLEQWAEANRYTIWDRSWNVTIKGEPQPLGTIRQIRLRPIDHYGAWHIALGGPAWNAMPPLDVVSASTNNPAETFVSIELGSIPFRPAHHPSLQPDHPSLQVASSLRRTIESGSPVVSATVRDELNPVPKWLASAAMMAILLVAGEAYRRWRTKNSSALDGSSLTESATLLAHRKASVIESVRSIARTEAFAWTCAIASICFGSMGLFLPMVMLRLSASVFSIATTFLIGLAGAVAFGILGRRVMKYAIPIALIVMGGLLLLAPIVSHTYEYAQIRQLEVQLSLSGRSQSLAPTYNMQPYDGICIIFGGFMVGGGAVWPLLANVLSRLFGPRRGQTAKASDEIEHPSGDARLTY